MIVGVEDEARDLTADYVPPTMPINLFCSLKPSTCLTNYRNKMYVESTTEVTC